MANIVIKGQVETLKKLLLEERVASPSTHVALGDGCFQLWIVPKTTSRHRHYISFTAENEEDYKKAKEVAAQAKFKVVEGCVVEIRNVN